MPVSTSKHALAVAKGNDAKSLAERLKDRVFLTIFPRLAQGFLEDRKRRLGLTAKPSDAELRDTFETTLTLLFRLLFLLYAEARELLPIREPAYRAASLTKIADEIAQAAGSAESEVELRIENTFAADETRLYDRLQNLFTAIDQGDRALNVPTHGGGLFATDPGRAAYDFLRKHKVPDRQLALAIDRLARDPDDNTLSLMAIDYQSLEVRHLGSIYEGLLEFQLRVADEDLTTQTEKKAERYVPLKHANTNRGKIAQVVVRQGTAYLSNDNSQRKASGSYYTPDTIVEYIVRHTIGPVLDEKLAVLGGEFRKAADQFSGDHPSAAQEELVERLFELRLLDPAMGSGHFLVAALDFITQRLSSFLHQFPLNPVAFLLEQTRRGILKALCEQGVTIDRAKLTDANLLRRHVLKRCIYGVDLNPMAVELAKMSLWLDAFTLGSPLSLLDDHLRCGNALIGATTEATSFDAVVGNPPYAGHKGDFDAAPLNALFQVCRKCSNPAVAFLERGFQLLRENGRLGMIVPKSIQYVESWADARRLLAVDNQLVRIADVSQAFGDVLLEQTVCLAAKGQGGKVSVAATGYLAETLGRDGSFSGRRIKRDIADSVECLPARVDLRSLRLLERVVRAGPRLASIGKTSQALGFQAHLNRDVTGRRFPIYRGKQIRPLRIDPPADFIDRSYLLGTDTGTLTPKVQDMLRPKVVSQNIVAHVTRPKPRVWIISAPDHEGIVCLNTISTTILHDERFPIDYVAAVLNSTLASWFYTEFVFCRAIRTMHFDNYYAGKLPIAELAPSDRQSFEQLAGQFDAGTSRGERQRAIDEAVFDVYALTKHERQFLYEFCYGTERVEAVPAGF